MHLLAPVLIPKMARANQDDIFSLFIWMIVAIFIVLLFTGSPPPPPTPTECEKSVSMSFLYPDFHHSDGTVYLTCFRPKSSEWILDSCKNKGEFDAAVGNWLQSMKPHASFFTKSCVVIIFNENIYNWEEKKEEPVTV